MAEGASLFNIGELAKPATVLVEKVCGAIGIVYEPTRIKRKAAADAAAEVTLASARIEISEMQRRGIERLIVQEGRKQENIEKIVHDAAMSMTDGATPELLDDDWLVHFFDQCAKVSDSQLQGLWSKVLATEGTAPGAVSKKTVHVVGLLNRKDADLFTALCQFTWILGPPTAIVFDLNAEIYKAAGITFMGIKHLDSLGLLSFDPIGGYTANTLTGDHAHGYYFNTEVLFTLPSQDARLPLGKVMFTEAGRQLFALSGATRNERFIDYSTAYWAQSKIKLSRAS